MMMEIGKFVFVGAVALVFVTGCGYGEIPPGTDVECVNVSFVPIAEGRTKSSIRADEDLLRDYNLLFYRDGMLERKRFVDLATDGGGDASVDVDLIKGAGYDIYALGNVGEIDTPLRESDFLDGCCLEYRSVGDFDGVFPMAWMEKDIIFTTGSSVSVSLARLVAKVRFSLDADSVLGRLSVRSVRLRQAAGKVWPFMEECASHIDEASDAVDGDYSSEEDIESVNQGGTLTFYCLENCQGTLLPENSDEWGKVPDSLDGDVSSLCTYLEVEASFDGDFALDGGVLYRLYLGNDALSNFDIERNTVLNVSLFATRDGLDRISWRVESEGTYRDGLAEGRLLEGEHALDGMYVGELFRYGVDISQSLADYLGEELANCYVCSRQGAVSFDGTVLSGLELSCEGKCVGSAEGDSLVLVTPRGDIFLGEARVSLPSLILSRDSNTATDSPVSALSSCPKLTVNGASDTLYLYCTDAEGYCLNSSAAYGFDAGLFDLGFSRTAYAGNMMVSEAEAEALRSTFHVLDMDADLPQRDAPLASYVIAAENTGEDSTVNRKLGYAVFASQPFSIDIAERNYALAASTKVNYDIFPVKVTAYGPWADENAGVSELTLGVENRSAIYLDILLWTHALKRTATTHSMQTWASQYSSEINSSGASKEDIIYATDSYFPTLSDYERKHYGSYCAFRFDRAELGGEVGDEPLFPVPSLNSTLLLRDYIYSDPAGYLTELSSETTSYSSSSWWYSDRNLYSIDIKADGLNLVTAGRLGFEDRFLEGGGAEASESYPYMGGFNVYSGGTLYSQAVTFLSTYEDCTPRNLYSMVTETPLDITLGYDTSVKKYYITCSNNTLGRKVGFKYMVEMEGTVTCHPNGQWYKAVVHDVSGSAAWAYNENITPGTSKTYIDGGAVSTLMNKIYSMSYQDNSSNIGSSSKDYQHFCHPTEGTITLEMRSAETGRLLPYTICVDPSAESLPFYHSQDAKTYDVAMTISYPSYWQFGCLK